MSNEQRYEWAAPSDLRWWYDQLKALSVETEAALWEARSDNTPSMLEIETLTDRVIFLDKEIVDVLDELDRRVEQARKEI